MIKQGEKRKSQQMHEKLKLQIEYIPIEQLMPYEKNTKIHNEKNVEYIKNSIREFGMSDPIGIWSDKNIIVEGHGRLMALKELGYTEAPCIRLDHMSNAERRAYAMAHNKTAESSEWDYELTESEIEEISKDFDMSDFGFDDIEIDQPENQYQENEDIIPEPQEDKEPICKIGDIWQLGKHRLMCGDSTNRAQVERLMNGEKADISFSSPPYNAGTTATEVKLGKKTKYDGKDDNKSNEEYCNFLNNYLSAAIEYCEYVFMNVQSISNNKIALIDVLYTNKDIYADTLIWDKKNGQPAMAHNVLNSCFEYIHCFSKKANRAIGTIEFRGTIDNIVRISPQRHNNYANIHNATFSVEFASWFIERFAKKLYMTLSAAQEQR